MGDYYKALGIGINATPKQVKAAFRTLAFKLHPDKNIGTVDASKQDAYRKVSEAYEVLNDSEKRREYDKHFMFQKGFQQGYDKYQSGSRYTSPATPRKQTEFYPGGAQHARTRHEQAYVRRDQFNLHEWNAGHYGETAESPRTGADRPKATDHMGKEGSGGGGRSGKAWMNMAGNMHQNYYRKKAARDAANVAYTAAGVGVGGSGDGAKTTAAAYAAQAEHWKNQRNNAADNLARNREARRQGATSSREESDTCVIS